MYGHCKKLEGNFVPKNVAGGLEVSSVTRKKSPNVYKSCPKMISQEKSYILTTLQILPNNVRDLGKLIVAKVFKKLSKVQKIAQSGHHTSASTFNVPTNWLL